LLYLRDSIEWRSRKIDRFLAALGLSALHGESHRSPNCFSNRMPRTISTKPAYSVRWWDENGYTAPRRDVFEILREIALYRYRTGLPANKASVRQCDARQVSARFPNLSGEVTDIITSPPYLDTTNFAEDQWLRLLFLGEDPSSARKRADHRHCDKENYWRFLEEAWSGVAPLLADRARIVVRIGGRRVSKDEALQGLTMTLKRGLKRKVRLADSGVSSEIMRSQANVFRGGIAKSKEHDFCFLIR